MDTEISAVLQHYDLALTSTGIQPFGSGHIHQTYRIFSPEPAHPGYILQRINHEVFRQVEVLMDNFSLVTRHIREKLTQVPGRDPDREVLQVLPTREGSSYVRTEAGRYWRLLLFIPGSKSYDLIQNPAQAEEGGRAFGEFITLLADVPPSTLRETIPDFHHIGKRLVKFEQVLAADSLGRAREQEKWIHFVQARAEEMQMLLRQGAEGILPMRITHNDTKFNNVLLDAHDKALCVVDLDTVMPGFMAYDFGDAIRTGASTAAEDAPDLARIAIDMDIYRGFARGFLQACAGILTEAERKSLAFGAKLMTYIMAVRFLTDFIEGDVYYHIHYPQQNLARAKAQLTLLQAMEARFEEMEEGVETIWSQVRKDLPV